MNYDNRKAPQKRERVNTLTWSHIRVSDDNQSYEIHIYIEREMVCVCVGEAVETLA